MKKKSNSLNFIFSPANFMVFTISVLFAKANPYLNSLTITKTLTLTVALWGLLIALRYIICFCYVYKRLYFVLFALFGSSYSITIFLNRDIGLLKNLQDLLWFFVCIIVLVGTFFINDEYVKVFKKVLTVFVLLSFLCAFFSLPFVFFNKGGRANWGNWGFYNHRLWGLYKSPNYGSLYCALSIALSLYGLSPNWSKTLNCKNKIFLIFNCIIQFLYIVYSGSNTGKVVLGICIGMFALYHIVIMKTIHIKSVTGSLLLISLLLLPLGYKSIKSFTSWSVNSLSRSSTVASDIQNGSKSSELPTSSNASFSLKRKDTSKYGLSNGRTFNWKVGLTVFTDYSVFGTSMRKYATVAKAYDSSPRTQRKALTLENDFVSLLVCTGCVGTLLFCAAVITIAIRFFKYLIFLIRQKHLHTLCNIWPAFSLICIVGITMFFTDAIVFTNVLHSVMFWISLGFILRKMEWQQHCEEIIDDQKY